MDRNLASKWLTGRDRLATEPGPIIERLDAAFTAAMGFPEVPDVPGAPPELPRWIADVRDSFSDQGCFVGTEGQAVETAQLIVNVSTVLERL